MSVSNRSSRPLAEGAAIVISILLAFAIDAWWDNRVEDRLRENQLRSLVNEFEENREALNHWIELHDRSLEGTNDFLNLLENTEQGQLVAIPAETVALTLLTPTFDPSMGGIDSMIMTGQMSNIGNAELQTALAGWPAYLADAAEDELAAKSFVELRLIPYLEQHIPLRPMFDYRPRRKFDGQVPGPVNVERSVQLENLVARRRQHAALARGGLRRLEEQIDRIQQLFETELNGEGP